MTASLLGTTGRADGSLQVTYGGRPLYYVGDRSPGQILCQNVREYGGLWLHVRASVRLVLLVVSEGMAKEASGRFVVRIPRGLHTELTRQARDQRVSLNQYVATLLAGAAGWRGMGTGSAAVPMGLPGYMPDHRQERRADYLRSTPGERLAEAIRLSRTATRLASAGAAERTRR